MKAAKLRAILDKLPPTAEIYVRVGSDDAYPAEATCYEECGKPVLFLGPTMGDHLNYPEGYSGAKQIKL